MTEFKKLRVRAYLQTGVVSDQFLPLDGILYYQMIRRALGEKDISKPGESNIRESIGLSLPIRKAGREDHTWYYRCSFAQWSKNTVEDSTFKVKQGDWLRFTDYLSDKTKKIDNSRGKFKSYHIKMYYRHAEYIEWYCVGIPDQIMKLLPFCTHIGKNTGDGWGAVKNWEVMEWPENWSVRGPGGKLMRAIPIDEGEFQYGIRPSYWNERHIFPVLMP